MSKFYNLDVKYLRLNFRRHFGVWRCTPLSCIIFSYAHLARDMLSTQFWKHLYTICVFSTLYLVPWQHYPLKRKHECTVSILFPLPLLLYCFIFSHNPYRSSAWSCGDGLNCPDVSYQQNRQLSAHLEGWSSAWLWNSTPSPAHYRFYICPLAGTQMLKAFSQQKQNAWRSGASKGPRPACTAASSRGSEDNPSFQGFPPAASQHDSGRENAQLRGV